MVNAHYSITARELRFVDRDPKKGKIHCGAHSGTDDYADVGKPAVGPLPAGSYHLYYRSGLYLDNYAFVLDPVDTVPLNDGWDDRPDHLQRGAFRIHVMTSNTPPYGSKGCIVLPAPDLKRLKAFCDATVHGPVETVRSPNSDGSVDKFTSPLLGTLVVES